jgi:uncharacterized protein (DUF2147 family)
MRALLIVVLAGVAAVLPIGGLSAQQGEDKAVVGTWSPPEQDSVFEIYPCEEGRYCGKITMISEVNAPAGSSRVDVNNQDPSLRDRPLLGMIFLTGFRYEGNGSYQDGRIYNPRDGKVYKANMKLEDGNNRLRVRGYVGVPMMGQTQVWTRAR